MRFFYPVDKRLETVYAKIEANDGVLTPELELELNCAEVDFDAQVSSHCSMVKNLELDAATAKAEAKRLSEVAKKLEERAKGHMSSIEKLLQGKDWQMGTHAIKWKTSEAIETELKPEELPECYRRVKYEADKRQMTVDIKAGAEIPGVILARQLYAFLK